MLVTEVRRELPEDGTQLLAQVEHARGEEIGERGLDVLQPQHVRDVARPLDGKYESFRCVRVPTGIAGRPLQRIERAVDLDDGKDAGRVLEFGMLWQVFGIKRAAPRFVAPTGDADAYGIRHDDHCPPSRVHRCVYDSASLCASCSFVT